MFNAIGFYQSREKGLYIVGGFFDGKSIGGNVNCQVNKS